MVNNWYLWFKSISVSNRFWDLFIFGNLRWKWRFSKRSFPGSTLHEDKNLPRKFLDLAEDREDFISIITVFVSMNPKQRRFEVFTNTGTFAAVYNEPFKNLTNFLPVRISKRVINLVPSRRSLNISLTSVFARAYNINVNYHTPHQQVDKR